MQYIYFCGGYQICFPLSVSPREVAAHLFGLASYNADALWFFA